MSIKFSNQGMPLLMAAALRSFVAGILVWIYAGMKNRKVLEQTVRDYNRAVLEGGQDPFGKPLVDGAHPMEKPPFYAIRLWPKVHHTPGGV